MEKIYVPIGEEFVAPDKHTYKAERAARVFDCRGCAFLRIHKLCHRYSCFPEFREDHTAVIFVSCEKESQKGE